MGQSTSLSALRTEVVPSELVTVPPLGGKPGRPPTETVTVRGSPGLGLAGPMVSMVSAALPWATVMVTGAEVIEVGRRRVGGEGGSRWWAQEGREVSGAVRRGGRRGW